MIYPLTESIIAMAMWGIVIGLVMFVLGVLLYLIPCWHDLTRPDTEDNLNHIGCNCAVVGAGIAIVSFGLLIILLGPGQR